MTPWFLAHSLLFHRKISAHKGLKTRSFISFMNLCILCSAFKITTRTRTLKLLLENCIPAAEQEGLRGVW